VEPEFDRRGLAELRALSPDLRAGDLPAGDRRFVFAGSSSRRLGNRKYYDLPAEFKNIASRNVLSWFFQADDQNQIITIVM
jgi:hypothetical protein